MLAKKAACTAAIRGGKSDFFRSQCKSDLGELPLEMRGKWTARWAARWIGPDDRCTMRRCETAAMVGRHA